MLHSVVSPNVGHPVTHHFKSGACVWGQAITPSVAHLVQTCPNISIDYTRVGPGIVFETLGGTALLPHVLDTSTFRLHAEAIAFFRQAAGRVGQAVEAILHCDAGEDYALKLWGAVTSEERALNDNSGTLRAETIPIIFKVSFWEISQAGDARMQAMRKESDEKDRRICDLEMQVALAMSSQ